MRKQQGLSLVELMISITLGLVLMTGVMQMFLSSRTVYTTHQAISRVQENGRLAMEFMSRDIRMAGFMGCMSRNMEFTNTLKIDDAEAEVLYGFGVGIEGATAGTGQPTGYPAALTGTDILVVRSASGNSAHVVSDKNSTSLKIATDSVVANACNNGSDNMISGLCKGDVVIITDCEKARAFQITNIQGSNGNVVHSKKGEAGDGGFSPGNDTASWGGNSGPPEEQFGPDSEIIRVTTNFYYIATNDAGRPGLWQKIGNSAAQEVLEGVENMQLTYGLDTDGNGVPNEYLDAAAVGSNWDDVLSVRVQLLVVSLNNNVLEEPQPYTFNGTTVTPDDSDRRMRQVFVNTIGIRSRLP
ncbi:PilW family protein [Marinimicrobium sp. ABcell2]|uniref:PilW family protein n=1 Tax=Marinimicrobium sp. ABcell2 TaxID=3069751 RepID=UPI0027B4E9BB|nr:PilW family protein [Marinimicrobium sp. ABcell2]MDQ2078123.1 PilW family protein [Marinimicrobium sp. ABcell2]